MFRAFVLGSVTLFKLVHDRAQIIAEIAGEALVLAGLLEINPTRYLSVQRLRTGL